MNAKYAIYRLLHILHINGNNKPAYFCTFSLHIFAYSTNKKSVFLHILCKFVVFFWRIPAYFEYRTAYYLHIYAYFWHISYKFLAYSTPTVYIFLHMLCILFTNNCVFLAHFLHASAGSVPASRVASCSCTIPASPTTTGSCAFFIVRKLMRICPGMATPRRRPGRSTGPPHRTAARHSPQQQQPPPPPPPKPLHFSCSCGRTK